MSAQEALLMRGLAEMPFGEGGVRASANSDIDSNVHGFFHHLVDVLRRIESRDRQVCG